MAIEDYHVGQIIGKGGFATVYWAKEHASGKEVALKTIEKSLIHERNISARIINEIRLHSRLKHPAIVALSNFFEDEERVYMVLELCKKGDLHRDLRASASGKKTEDEVREILRQLVQGVQYLHSSRIMHRDLKLSNILLTEDNKVKICDFGLAVQLELDEEHYTLCGTPNYIAPEIVNRVAHGLAADLWSLGCMMYTLLVGKAPFQGSVVSDTLSNVSSMAYVLPEWLSEAARSLLQGLLCKDPDKRLKPEDILRHPFLMNRQELMALEETNRSPFVELKTRGLSASETEEPRRMTIDRAQPRASAPKHYSRKGNTQKDDNKRCSRRTGRASSSSCSTDDEHESTFHDIATAERRRFGKGMGSTHIPAEDDTFSERRPRARQGQRYHQKREKRGRLSRDEVYGQQWFAPYWPPWAGARHHPCYCTNEPGDAVRNIQLEDPDTSHYSQPRVQRRPRGIVTERHKHGKSARKSRGKRNSESDFSLPRSEETEEPKQKSKWSLSRIIRELKDLPPFLERSGGVEIQLKDGGVLDASFPVDGLKLTLEQNKPDSCTVTFLPYSKRRDEGDKILSLSSSSEPYRKHFDVIAEVLFAQARRLPAVIISAEIQSSTSVTRNHFRAKKASSSLWRRSNLPEFHVTFDCGTTIHYMLDEEVVEIKTVDGRATWRLDTSDKAGSWMSSLPATLLPLIGVSQTLLQASLDLDKEGEERLATKEVKALINLDQQFQAHLQIVESERSFLSSSVNASPVPSRKGGLEDEEEDFARRYLFDASEPLREDLNSDEDCASAKDDPTASLLADLCIKDPSEEKFKDLGHEEPENSASGPGKKQEDLTLSLTEDSFHSQIPSVAMEEVSGEFSEVPHSVSQFSPWTILRGIGKGRVNGEGDLHLEFEDGCRLTLSGSGAILAFERVDGVVSLHSLLNDEAADSLEPISDYLQHVSHFTKYLCNSSGI